MYLGDKRAGLVAMNTQRIFRNVKSLFLMALPVATSHQIGKRFFSAGLTGGAAKG